LTESGEVRKFTKKDGRSAADSWTPFYLDEEAKAVNFTAKPLTRLLTTDTGKLFESGLKNLTEKEDNFIAQMNNLNDEELREVTQFGGEDKVLKTWMFSGADFNVAYAQVQLAADGKTKLFSIGWSNEGLLGQGSEVTESKNFAPMIYETDVHFKDLYLVETAVYGITIEGDVWLLGGKRSTPKVDQSLSPFVTSFKHN